MNQSWKILRVAIIILAGGFVSVGLSILLLNPQFYIKLFMLWTVWTKFSPEKIPEVYIMPLQLSVSQEEGVNKFGLRNNKGTKLSFLRYEVEVPWIGIDEKITKESGACFIFLSPRVVCFFENVDFKKAMIGNVPEKDQGTLRDVFGEESFTSNYSLFAAILKTSPKHLSLFTPHKEVVQTSIFTVLKSTFLSHADDEVYLFQNDNLRGILIVSPSMRGYARLYIFDNQNKGIEIWVLAPKKGDASLSQGEIEQIIQTVRTKD